MMTHKYDIMDLLFSLLQFIDISRPSVCQNSTNQITFYQNVS